MKELNVSFRIAEKEDAEKLLEIYAYYVENTAISFEHEVPALEEFEMRIHTIQKRYPYIVAESDDKIVGYSYINTFKPREAYSWAAEISIYVHKDYRGMGIGNKLYDVMEKAAQKQNILNLEACIAYPSEGKEDEYLTFGSVHFHEKCGYRLVGEFKKCGYKFGKWYNMVWMEKHIGQHQTPQPAVIDFEKIKKDIF